MSRRAFTLIEMLVALAATLLMMGATVTLFGVIVDSVSGSRALLEISDKLRATRNRIQADLQGATATMRPPRRPENDEGYLEIVEGPNNDKLPLTTGSTLFGDTDDVLMLTVRSRGEPFIGKFAGIGTVESQVAEVMYFAVPDGPIIDVNTNPPTRLYTLYRRVLLVRQFVLPAISPPPDFYLNYDVSAHVEFPGGSPVMIANTLGDLTKRENRFAHYGPFPSLLNTYIPPAPGSPIIPPPNYPTQDAFLLPFHPSEPNANPPIPIASPRLGDDILMTNVLAFDVQVFDPNAPIYLTPSPNQVAAEPRDPGFGTGTVVGTGAYVDLGYVTTVTSPRPLFDSVAWQPQPGTTQLAEPTGANYHNFSPSDLYSMVFKTPTNTKANPIPPAAPTLGRTFIYDTWSLHYENNGLDEDGLYGADAATNGLDDDTNGVVDDVDERDTMAPYPAQLRGMRITIRVYEPSSLQVRQVTIVQDFLPE